MIYSTVFYCITLLNYSKLYY